MRCVWCRECVWWKVKRREREEYIYKMKDSLILCFYHRGIVKDRVIRGISGLFSLFCEKKKQRISLLVEGSCSYQHGHITVMKGVKTENILLSYFQDGRVPGATCQRVPPTKKRCNTSCFFFVPMNKRLHVYCFLPSSSLL